MYNFLQSDWAGGGLQQLLLELNISNLHILSTALFDIEPKFHSVRIPSIRRLRDDLAWLKYQPHWFKVCCQNMYGRGEIIFWEYYKIIVPPVPHGFSQLVLFFVTFSWQLISPLFRVFCRKFVALWAPKSCE